MLKIDIAFASGSKQIIKTIHIAENTSIKQAIILSQIQVEFPEFNLLEMPIGIFGKKLLDIENHKLRNFDRIEIYRPLSKSPNQKRLERAKK